MRPCHIPLFRNAASAYLVVLPMFTASLAGHGARCVFLSFLLCVFSLADLRLAASVSLLP